jgi:hypothetical protein
MKKKSKNRGQIQNRALPHQTKGEKVVAILKILAIPLAIVPALALWWQYKSAEVDTLRNKIYQPLFSEISEGGPSLLGGGIETFSMATFNDLSEKGELNRIPSTLRRRIVASYQQLGQLQSDMSVITDVWERSISQSVMAVRTDMDDHKWLQLTSKKLRAESQAEPGISTLVRGEFNHTARGKAIDVRNPNHPVVAGPGGPTWNINDWITYPESVKEIEKIWTRDDFLYFDPVHDSWYYRITRADLDTHRIGLRAFLKPTYDRLALTTEFKHFVQVRIRAAEAAQSLSTELADRIRSPRQLSDLMPWQ